jgi:hypothetical protein
MTIIQVQESDATHRCGFDPGKAQAAQVKKIARIVGDENVSSSAYDRLSTHGKTVEEAMKLRTA